MERSNFRNQGQSLIGIIIVLVIAGLISGGLWYYFSRQIPEIPEITKKPPEEEITEPEEEVEVVPEEIIPEEELAPPGELINVGVIIFKYSDTVLPDVLYCRWPNGERTLTFEECYDVNYGEGEILSKYSVLDLITDSVNKERVFQYNVIRSLYYLPDYFRNEASKYGFDLKMNLHLQGVFDLTEPLPQTFERPTGLLLKDYYFFIRQAEKRIDLSSFDKLIIIFLNDQDFQDREGFGFRSAALQPTTAIINFRIRGDLFFNNYLDVLLHEFQHVLGASDLYLEPCPRGPYWDCCRVPEGIPEPNKIPKYPQTKACSMCTTIQLNAEGLGQVAGLKDTVICQTTAKEMGWIK